MTIIPAIEHLRKSVVDNSDWVAISDKFLWELLPGILKYGAHTEDFWKWYYENFANALNETIDSICPGYSHACGYYD